MFSVKSVVGNKTVTFLQPQLTSYSFLRITIKYVKTKSKYNVALLFPGFTAQSSVCLSVRDAE